MRIGMLKGAGSARELRFPWVLRSMVWTIMQDPRHQDASFGVVAAPMMGVRLIQQARHNSPTQSFAENSASLPRPS